MRRRDLFKSILALPLAPSIVATLPTTAKAVPAEKFVEGYSVVLLDRDKNIIMRQPIKRGYIEGNTIRTNERFQFNVLATNGPLLLGIETPFGVHSTSYEVNMITAGTATIDWGDQPVIIME